MKLLSADRGVRTSADRGVRGAPALPSGASFGGVRGAPALPKLFEEYLPEGLDVSQSGAKWVVAGGAKAGKLALVRGTEEIDEAKSKFTDNMSHTTALQVGRGYGIISALFTKR